MVVDLAKMEVLNYNKRDLERMLENERHQPSRSVTKKSKEQGQTFSQKLKRVLKADAGVI